MYKQTGAQPGAEQAQAQAGAEQQAQSGAQDGGNGEKVVDADYKVVDDDKK